MLTISNDNGMDVEHPINTNDVKMSSNGHSVNNDSPTTTTTTTSLQQSQSILQNDENNDLDMNTLTSRLIERSSYRNSRRRNHNGSSSSSHRQCFATTFKHDENVMTNMVPISRKFVDCSPTTMTELTTDKDYLDYIAKLQMDSLIPLKEDVADWLNRTLNLDESINIDNFMERLENGVLVFKLIRVIEDQICAKHHSDTNMMIDGTPIMINDNGRKLDGSQSVTKKFITMNKMNGHHQLIGTTNSLNRRCSLPIGNENVSGSQPMFNSIGFLSAYHMKCWENAKPHTFFARDNVSNFLEWCRRFGVKDAVLFETEDLVSHVNQRNVVLCILEVARIACTKYSFSPAPGLVELEQEIDREIERELQLQKQAEHTRVTSNDDRKNCQKPEIPDKPATLRTKTAQHHSRNICRQLWPNNENDATIQQDDIDSIDSTRSSFANTTPLTLVNQQSNGSINRECRDDDEEDITLISAQNDSKDVGFVDADSGCSYSSSNHSDSVLPRSPSSNSVLSSTSSSAASATYFGDHGGCTTETSSTCSSTPTPMTSELDHKVMQIAKTYYGKEARQGVQRLSEGKYKIANRIVFVRLLKARHVMVRVGGGWTTLSHFLARHGGDPNQQILPDELLPLDTKSSQMNCPNGGMNSQSRTANANRHHHSHRIHNNNNNGSTTHTLVISTTTKTTTIHNPNNNVGSARKSSMTSDLLKLTNNNGQQKFISTNGRNVGMMSINSTPVSRRNSVSSTADSPEPSYHSTSATNSVLSTIAPLSSQTKIPILRQTSRSRLPSMIGNETTPSSKQLLRSTSSIISISPSQELSTYLKQQQLRQQTMTNGKIQYTQHSMIPRSTTEFGQMRRYANYLRSSQHITNKESIANSNTSINSQQSQTPTIRPNHRPSTAFGQKTC
ncbi:flocculation protein flo11-like [Dermatophagoides farinae]|uniref:Flocculation protein flo11-like n=1 Tax=Dermatophagoides farinae TaxID=6954 RepID=A0A9D4NZV9_DERFA|nr:putative uncharacterized protein DDB_G0277255 [Dermatophagoides farinae]KAH7640565.1 flocculation protein flo11-like [Dermatophagoides farinae]